MAYDRCVSGEPTGMPVETALFDQVTREPRLSDKVADMMLETILSRRLAVGDRLPSERELGEQFGVSRTVVRQAAHARPAPAHSRPHRSARPRRRPRCDVRPPRRRCGVLARKAHLAGGGAGDRRTVTQLRRLDHVAVLVRDTDAALDFYAGRLGL